MKLGRWWWLGALALYVALAAYQLYPAWWDLDHGVVGDWRHPDMISNHWLYRWVAERLTHGLGILHNDRYYVPFGDAPWLAGNGSDGVPYTLFAAFVPWPASLTLWVLNALVLNGLSGLVLARRLGSSPAAATAAGAALALFPYVDVELSGGRFAQMPVYWVGFFLAAWHTLLEHAPTEGPAIPDRATLRRALVAAALFGAAAFTYWYHGLWAALLGVIWFAFRPRWRALVPFVPAALLVTVPPLLVFLLNWSAIPGTAEEGFPHPIACQSSLPPWFPLQGRPGFWGPVILPLVILVPALIALLPTRLMRRLDPDAPSLHWGHRAAIVGAILFWALCLGPYPSWMGGAESGFPGPFQAVYGWAGPLRRFWWPYRHVVGFLVALVPVAALGLDRLLPLLARFAEARIRPWVPAAAVCALVVTLPGDLTSRGGIVATPSSQWTAPEAYAAIAALPGDGLVELPLTPARVTGQQTLSYQWIHTKKLLNGHAMWVDRVRPAGWDAHIAEVPLWAAFTALERGDAVTFTMDAASRAALATDGIRLAILNAEYFPGTLAPLLTRYRTALVALFGEPAVDQDGIAAWDLTKETGATADVPAEHMPAAAIASEGKVPDYGTVNPAGWATINRDIPPRVIEDIPK